MPRPSADADLALALAGVMGRESEASTDATRSILLESARFQPLCIRKTSRRAQPHRSDSLLPLRARDIDPTLPLPRLTSQRAIELIPPCKPPAGNVVGDSGRSPERNEAIPQRLLHLRLSALYRVLGIQFRFCRVDYVSSFTVTVAAKTESNQHGSDHGVRSPAIDSI